MYPEKNDNDFVYDIAFSYASEQSKYVSEVYRILKGEYNVKVFYDKAIETQIDMWGNNLGEMLQKVYEKQSKWCLLFISKDYKDSVWARHEIRSALARAIKEKEIYLLPARFDDTEIEGIPSTTVYLNLSNMTPEVFSEYVLGKLRIPLKQRSISLPSLDLHITSGSDKGSEISAIKTLSKAPDGKPVVEYNALSPYSQDMDKWMREYAQKHRTSNNEELHLFTFSNGKQFEYHLLSTSANTSEKGFLYATNWTKEPNETLQPTKISEQQFHQNLKDILNRWSGSYKWKSDDKSDEVLVVQLGEKLASFGYDGEASVLKNYMDFKPDKTVYKILILTPSAIDGMNISTAVTFTPQNHSLVEKLKTLPENSFKPTVTVWDDATYTSIVKAIETNDFTNNPGKVGNPKS